MLTYHPVPGTPEVNSPFAGQTLTVLYGVVDLEASPVTYQLDSGGRFLASWNVHTLLAAPVGAAPLPVQTSFTDSQPPCLETAFTDNNRRYSLTGTRSDNGQLTVELTISTSQGEIHGELCGAIDDNDLQPLARLLAAASRTLTSAAPTTLQPLHHAAWTQQDSARLTVRFSQERNFAILATEFGCHRSTIYKELKRLGLMSDPGQQRTSSTHQTPATTSPILQQRRQVHRNSHARWTEEDDRRLCQRCAEGATNEELSEEFGRSGQAIDARLLKIGATGPAADEARSNAF
jgi:hypothetical protein